MTISITPQQKRLLANVKSGTLCVSPSKLSQITREQFAEQIKAHRARLGITQQEAADLCRIKLRTWSDWELQKGSPPKFPTMLGALELLKAGKVKK